jgi:hypothetical protein
MAKLVAVGRETIDSRDIMTANPLPNGKFTLSKEDGEVLSVQPDGRREFRPAGTVGPYEQCSLSGDRAKYYYRDAQGILRYHLILVDQDLPENS